MSTIISQIKNGTEFKLKPEWMDEGDEEFIALESVDGDRFRCVIISGPTLNSQQIIRVEWVDYIVVDGVQIKL